MSLKIGVLVSGSGSNLQALLDACSQPDMPAEVVLVVSNKPGVKALERAQKAGVPSEVWQPKAFCDRHSYDAHLVSRLQSAGVELVCLAGFMRLISDVFQEGFPGRIMNIHPSLLPAFPGLHAQRQALDYGVRISGCTVHFVDSGVDTGPVIIQAAVPVHRDDDETSLAQRIQQQEHRIYPEAVRLFAQNRLRLEKRHVIIDPPVEPEGHILCQPGCQQQT